MAQKLLLADDSITMQRLVSLTFADERIEVVSVGDGGSVVRRMKEIRPDIILVDVFLPVKNGYEICELVKSDPQMKHVPVLLLVGTFEPLDPSEAQRVKADGHLTKPFESSVLVNVVKDLLTKAPPTAPEPPAGAPKAAEAGQSIPTPVEPEVKVAASAPVAPLEKAEPARGAGHAGDTAQPAAEISIPVSGPPPTPEPKTAAVPNPPAEIPPLNPEAAPGESPAPAPVPHEAVVLETEAPLTFAVSPEARAGNSHPASEEGLESLLELDLDVTDIDEQTHTSFMVAPILDIYNEPAREALESDSSAPSVSTAVEEELLPSGDLLLDVVEPGVAPQAPAVAAAPVAPVPVPAPAGGLSEEWIEAVAQRVIQKLSDTVIREIAWEVVPELSELIIREQVEKHNKPRKKS